MASLAQLVFLLVQVVCYHILVSQLSLVALLVVGKLPPQKGQ